MNKNSSLNINYNNGIESIISEQQASGSNRLFTYSNFAIARACIAHRYNLLPKSIRSIFDIPVNTVQIVSNWFLPSILFTEGLSVLSNFGFSWNKMTNNILFCSMLGSTFASLYITSWYFDKYSDVFSYFGKMDDLSIPDDEFYEGFYNILLDFSKASLMVNLFNSFGKITESLLVRRIVLEKQYRFLQEWLTNFSIFDFKMGDLLSVTGMEHEKENLLSPITLFQDIKIQASILSLWRSRIDTAITFYSACCLIFTQTPFISIPL